jgi:shikimate kinase
MIRTPNLVLIGFMGSGKSSAGRKCAAMLGYAYHDTDTWITRKAHKSIPQIFQEDGERAFRDLEREAVRALACRSAIVLSTGGGAVLDRENVKALRENGFVVLLEASVETVLERTGRREARPLLQCDDPEARVRELLAQRESAYRDAAHEVLDTTSLTPDEVASRIVALYRCHAQ